MLKLGHKRQARSVLVWYLCYKTQLQYTPHQQTFISQQLYNIYMGFSEQLHKIKLLALAKKDPAFWLSLSPVCKQQGMIKSLKPHMLQLLSV